MKKHTNNQPIGIFDSGVGGLTIAKAIREHLPNENLIYLGDTAHTPWGDKSAISVQRYTSRICEVLLKSNCKAIVIACNTASALSLKDAIKAVGDNALLIDVITPVVNYISQNFSNNKIGLIATKQTIASNYYVEKLTALNPQANITTLATPLLVPLVEENFIDHPATDLILQEYLSKSQLQDIEALILGCTHYPLIKSQIDKYYKGKIQLIDSAQITAAYLKQQLNEHNLLAQADNISQSNFYISDSSQCFKNIANRFFAQEINLEYFPLWD